MSEQVQTLFGSDEAEAEMKRLEEDNARMLEIRARMGKRLVYSIGQTVDKLLSDKVRREDVLILLPLEAIDSIRIAGPVELIRGAGRLTLFGCRVGINKQSDRIFIGQEVKV